MRGVALLLSSCRTLAAVCAGLAWELLWLYEKSSEKGASETPGRTWGGLSSVVILKAPGGFLEDPP